MNSGSIINSSMFFDSSNIFGVRLVQLFNQLPTHHFFSAIALLVSFLSLSMPDFFFLFFFLFAYFYCCLWGFPPFFFSFQIKYRRWSRSLDLIQCHDYANWGHMEQSRFSFILFRCLFLCLQYFSFLFFIYLFSFIFIFHLFFSFLSFSFGLRSNHAEISGSLSITEIK